MPTENRNRQVFLEFTSSLADLGIILPLTLGMCIATGMNAGIALMGLGLFALASATIYRRPVPVQPMKLVAAMAIVGQLDQQAVLATGILLGLALVVLGLSGLAGKLKKLVPPTVLLGIQIALAASLMLAALPMIGPAWPFAAGLLLVFVLLKNTRLQPLAFVLVLSASLLLFGMLAPAAPADLSPELAIPKFHWPSSQSFAAAAHLAFLPQLALTLSNALFLTALIAQDYYPKDKARLTENRFALSSGALNLLLCPFGALPMCHGASGLTAYHTAGGRSGRPLLVLGAALLVTGFLTGAAAAHYLALIPQPAFGVLLLITATYLVNPKKLLRVSPACRVIVGLVAVIAVGYSMLAGLAAGLAMEALRTWSGKRLAARH